MVEPRSLTLAPWAAFCFRTFSSVPQNGFVAGEGTAAHISTSRRGRDARAPSTCTRMS
jgi:hypothetical protein